MNLETIEDLEKVIKRAIKDRSAVGLLIEMPGFEEPEMITNPVVNLDKKLEYYKDTYNRELEHKYSKGIRIVGYTLF